MVISLVSFTDQIYVTEREYDAIVLKVTYTFLLTHY